MCTAITTPTHNKHASITDYNKLYDGTKERYTVVDAVVGWTQAHPYEVFVRVCLLRAE